MFELIPCLVIAKGAVWLPPGTDTEVVSRNPLRLGLHFKALGAKSLYLVDLDAAHQEASATPAVLLGLAHSGLNLWVGGGVRSAGEAQTLLNAGAHAVVVRTLARHPHQFDPLVAGVGAEHVIVSLDISDGRLPCIAAARETIDAAETLGISRFIISSTGPNARSSRQSSEFLREMVHPSRWIGSGSGIRTSNDLLRLQRLGLNAAIVGRALYDHPIDGFWTDPDIDAG